ncbi:MAG: PKD domain-containing protein, partial [Thermoplasmata archaeon]|nr:PKD domain-containing protein [Thermoplasmata archaeon]
MARTVPITCAVVLLFLLPVGAFGVGLLHSGPPSSDHATGSSRPLAVHRLVPAGPTSTHSAAAPLPLRHAGPWKGGHPIPAGTPGAPPVLPSVRGMVRPGSPHPSSGGIIPPSNCFGVWPGSWGNQSTYEGDCYGHDEPGLDPYSNLPGSGGNVSWLVTLPVDGSSSTWQNAMYTAIWFGLVLSAPGAWLNECFLELQFYPDQTSNGIVTSNTWVGAAVAWQIDVTNGFEDGCYYSPLLDDATSGSLQMTGGDHLNVTLSGWVGNSQGETISIQDLTQGNRSTTVLYDFAYNAPLDPAYSTDTYPNALQWTPGGEMPVSFAFETGHTSSPYPNNNSYGGCSSGPFPPSGADPATPCPSYDPGLWSNGTDGPWQIAPPTFFNATARSTATQVDFTQDFGGLAWIDPLSGGTCAGRDGSAFCSYPWYSYSCGTGSFNFGATPYPGVAADFGSPNEYNSWPVTDLEGLGYFGSRNVSVPTCGAPSASLTLSVSGTAGGSALFLDRSVSVRTVINAVAPGNYSVDATPPAGAHFKGWNASGSVRVVDPTNPWSSVEIWGNGSLTAEFENASATVPVYVHLIGDPGFTGLAAGFAPGFAGTPEVATNVLNDSVYPGLPGVFSVQAYPPVGYNFSRWSWNGSLSLGASELPFTWFLLSGGGGRSANLTVWVVPSSQSAQVSLSVSGSNGTVSFAGGNYSLSGSVVVQVGTYAVVATPGPGSRWLSTSVYGDDVMLLDNASSTELVLQEGSANLDVTFGQNVSVRLETQGGAGGGISWAGAGPQPNGSVVAPYEAGSGAVLYPVAAAPAAGEVFAGWTVNNSSAISLASTSSVATVATLYYSSTLIAHFAAGTASAVLFDDLPAAGGGVAFNLGPVLSNGTTNSSLAAGVFVVQPVAAPEFRFTAWTTGGAVSIAAAPGLPGFYLLTVSSAGGTLSAHFHSTIGPGRVVTFVSSPSPAFEIRVNGTTLHSGYSAHLEPGSFLLQLLNLTGDPLGAWVATANLSVVGNSNGTATLFVNGSGTIYALAVGLVETRAAAHPLGGASPLVVSFQGWTLNGTAPFTPQWRFGDGTTETGAFNTTHTYSSAGRYVATLTVTDNRSDSASFALDVLVITPLSVSVRPSGTVGDVAFTVAFTTTVTGG